MTNASHPLLCHRPQQSEQDYAGRGEIRRGPKLTAAKFLYTIDLTAIEKCTRTLAIAMAEIQPSITPNLHRPKAGFTAYAERLNGRAAMVGFLAVIAIEYFTGHGVLSWLGLT